MTLDASKGEILFRRLTDPVPTTWELPHWQAEYHEHFEGPGVPLGLAWITERPDHDDEGQPMEPALAGPHLDYIEVLDGWRRLGIGKALLLACMRRWPDLRLSGPATGEGELLLKSIERESAS